jgi:putative copper export protein
MVGLQFDVEPGQSFSQYLCCIDRLVSGYFINYLLLNYFYFALSTDFEFYLVLACIRFVFKVPSGVFRRYVVVDFDSLT